MNDPRPAADAGEQRIIEAAFEERVKELFKIFAESIYTGEPEREAAARFRRGLVSAKRALMLALQAAASATADAEARPNPA